MRRHRPGRRNAARPGFTVLSPVQQQHYLSGLRNASQARRLAVARQRLATGWLAGLVQCAVLHNKDAQAVLVECHYGGFLSTFGGMPARSDRRRPATALRAAIVADRPDRGRRTAPPARHAVDAPQSPAPPSTRDPATARHRSRTPAAPLCSRRRPWPAARRAPRVLPTGRLASCPHPSPVGVWATLPPRPRMRPCCQGPEVPSRGGRPPARWPSGPVAEPVRLTMARSSRNYVGRFSTAWPSQWHA